MLKRMIAAGTGLALVFALGACRQEPETAVIDDGFQTMPMDTTPMGMPMDPTPGTVPPDTLGAPGTIDPVTGQPYPPTTP